MNAAGERRHSRFRCDETGCGKRARWFVVSGPMMVCWNHKQHYEAQGERCSLLGGAYDA